MTEPQEEPRAGESNGTATPETEALRARAETAERERDQYIALLKSTRAELENDLKRARKSFEEDKRYAHQAFALGVLQVLDNLERAMAEAKRANEKGPLVQGVSMTEAQMRDLLRRHGVTPIEALGKPFDPSLHQALLQQPSAEHPPFTVIGVLEQGYMIHERVLRPANVAVSVAPEKPGALAKE
jgi:molecular chaperone GrpE